MERERTIFYAGIFAPADETNIVMLLCASLVLMFWPDWNFILRGVEVRLFIF